jgi:hypothetical protein
LLVAIIFPQRPFPNDADIKPLRLEFTLRLTAPALMDFQNSCVVPFGITAMVYFSAAESELMQKVAIHNQIQAGDFINAAYGTGGLVSIPLSNGACGHAGPFAAFCVQLRVVAGFAVLFFTGVRS